MLSALFGSEARAKIFNLLLLDPEKKYSLKQFSKESGLTVAAIRKEMTTLQLFGLVKEDNDTWQANPGFIIFPELKALIAKAQILSSQRFIEGLKKIANPKFLALTGLFTGDQLVKTDILLVGSTRKKSFLKLINDLENDLGREINFTMMDETEFYYRQEVMDIFLYNILNGKTIFLINELTNEPALYRPTTNNKFDDKLAVINEASLIVESSNEELEEYQNNIDDNQNY